ncbi:amine dehydrogenase large subunit [Chthonobacter albigriseus]|uniref:amine dehydrogenase large subunit n=1 Tax=Chthonobacter albigriseus TaxID=1683161 RepID=UPI0015EEC2D2|nr:amine dehydrogenase large subunit [Chthonobacter albigriseus]
MIRPIVGIALFAAFATPAWAQDPLPEEEFIVKQAIDPGPNLFVYQESLDGPGTIVVFGADTLSMKGTMTSGAFGQMLVEPTGKTAFAQSTFMKRYAYGAMEHVLQIYDVATLTPKSEVILPPKAAMALSYVNLLQHSADGKYVFVQNATPASSITIVDLSAGTVLEELPTPGCWGIYPAATGAGFMTMCGDGSLMSYAPKDGKFVEVATTPAIFDPDVDALFTTGMRVGGDYAFISFKGDVSLVSDADGVPKSSGVFSMVDGVEGGWAPGGYQMVAYSPDLKLLFVLMHSKSYEGSHKNPAEELWAVDVATKKVVGRTPFAGFWSFTVSSGAKPALFGISLEMKVVRFDIDVSSGLSLTQTGEAGLTGYPFLLAATP